MPEPPCKKLNSGTSRKNGGNNSLGSAIIFWHEAEGSPPAVRAIAMKDLEPIIPGTWVTEKTVCRALYRDTVYHCVVIWIEEDKTPDELASIRLFPSSNERTYEDKGYRWATELGLMKHITKDPEVSHDLGNWLAQDARTPEPRSSSYDSESDAQGGSSDLGHPSVGHSEMATMAPESFRSGTLKSRTAGNDPLQDHVLDLSAQVIEMQETIAALRQSQPEPHRTPKRTMNKPMTDDGSSVDPPSFSASTSISSPPGTGHSVDCMPVPEDELLETMLLQSTWKKALKLAMKKTFTIDELITSVPTVKGAKMSKNGKQALDQDRLSVVKGLVEKYCAQKDVWQPTKEVIHQELGGILFSIREANSPVPRVPKMSNRKEAKLAFFSHQRETGKKSGSGSVRAYSFKLPSFASGVDLTEMKFPTSSSESPTN